MAKGKGGSKSSGGGPNPSRNNGKASKKNPKEPNVGATGKSRGGYNLVKRAEKAAAWDAAKKRAARKARRKAEGLAYKHGLRTGQLKRSTASADS
jgi:hypothetical protein